MRAQIISDTHFEFLKDKSQSFIDSLPTDCDVLILAGDISVLRNKSTSYISNLCSKFPKVFYVLGNHEYHRANNYAAEQIVNSLKQANSNLSILNNDVEEYLGKRFLGTTLWFPCSHETLLYEDSFIDFLSIMESPNWIYDQHKKAMDFLGSNIKQGDIVISHHLPSYKCISPQWISSDLNCYFACNADALFNLKPSFWIHAHSHEPLDMVIKKTRIIRNPYGYKHYGENPNWQPLILDL